MKAEKPAPETDKEPEAPHPRQTFSFTGHDAEERALSDALNGGRMHHAWMITGAKGLGKATLAYRFARVALGARRAGARPLDVDPEDQVARRIAALSHPDLFVLRRGPERARQAAARDRRRRCARHGRVLFARALGGRHARGDHRRGRRSQPQRRQRDLKTLEEPPANSVLLLVCHAPGAILPTIRSRCRRLPLRPLIDDLVATALGARDDAIVALAKGRPGRAIALKAQGLDAAAVRLDRAQAAIAKGEAASVLNPLYDKLSGEPFERLAAVLELAGEWTRAAGVEQGGEHWAEAWSQLETLRTEAEGLDMDPRHALARAVGVLDRAAAARR